MVNDPIADMLTRIRNAAALRRSEVRVPLSRLREAVLKVLRSEGYIDDFNISRKPAQPACFRVKIRYSDRAPVIRGLRRVSRPGRRVYRGAREILPVRSGLGIAVVSTSRGVMSDQACRQRALGGEILCEVW